MTTDPLAADNAARRIALTALDRTLLMEAGAGSGKTSVLAGRVAALLAAGRAPKEIAAITFTELAAGELRQRVVAFVTDLADGIVREDVRAAFPRGLDAAQRAALRQAHDSLDELVCTTIHGFCQRLLRPYPVEAGMDPGAAVMDAADAEAMLADVLEIWLRERLSGPRQPDDLLVALFVDDAVRAGALVRDLLHWLVHHRGAPVPDVPVELDALAGLRTAAKDLRRFLDNAPCREADTVQIADELDALLCAAPDSGLPEADRLVHVLRMSPPACRATSDGGWRTYRMLGRWRTAATARCSAMVAERLNHEASGCYAACQAAHEAAQAYAAGRVLQRLAGELHDVLARFATAKRAAALVDFDDLMVKARALLADNAAVRTALGNRYTAVLVDEFQDTDRLQTEILWRLCAAAPAPAVPWTDWPLRPGSLFLVGDPKQAIYRFRGADVTNYVAVRDRLIAKDAGARVVIGRNFRSLGPILDWVNARFAAPLSAAGQPGFASLFTTVRAPEGHIAVATLPIEPVGNKAGELRDAEAEAVAAFCVQVIGVLPVRTRNGERLCRPDDIVLLAPSGADLWRYERALENMGIAVSTQAGKGFFRRQEVQDLIALTRTLADARDTLAFGALLRGPLVGLTEEALLDAMEALPARDEKTPGRLFLWTPLEDVQDALLHETLKILLKETLKILQALARAAVSTTPFVLLSQAVEELQVRALIRQRQERTTERALANIDQFLEMARSYDTRGLRAFAQAMAAQWKEAKRSIEGRPDTEQQSVSLVTMHAAKGLEWAVVVPINMSGGINARVHAALDPEGRLHLPVFGRHGAGAAAALQAEREELDRERHRLWYVAATRARDLLLLPAFSIAVPNNSWLTRIGLDLEGLMPFDARRLGAGKPDRAEGPPNKQDHALFLVEAELIKARTHRIKRITPHLAEGGETVVSEMTPPPLLADDPATELPPPRGSRARGLVLHKLIEEVLTGETAEEPAALQARAAELASQLDETPGARGLEKVEAASTVLRALALPPIRTVRDRLVAECTVARSVIAEGIEAVTLGVADAVVCERDGTVSQVVDWKSDVAPSPATIAQYRAQLRTYLITTGATEGMLVFLTAGQIELVGSEITQMSARSE